MPSFGSESSQQLATADKQLLLVFNEVIKHWDCKVLEGKRSEEQQRKNVQKGVSKTMNSKHVYPLGKPSRAVDVAPWPLKWPRMHEMLLKLPADQRAAILHYAKELALWYYFSGFVLGTAEQMKIPLRHGGDWNENRQILDQNFDDLPHFELR